MKRKQITKFAVIALAAMGVCSAPVLAEEAASDEMEQVAAINELTEKTEALSALDELNGILEQQKNLKGNSLLGEYLGSEALAEAIKEKGFECKTTLGLQEGTLETFGAPAIFEDAYAELGVMWDPAKKCWSFHIGGGLDEDASISAQLYGDTEKLLLSCAPFYDGAIGISAGSFLDQYVGSGLEDLLVNLLEAPDISGIADFNLVFYPENVDLSGIQEPVNVIKEDFLKEIKKIENSLLVEKEVSGDEVIYHVNAETSKVLGIYQFFFTEFISLGLDMGAMDYEDAMEAMEEIMYFIEEAEEILGETIVIDFVTKNELLAGISYSMNILEEYYSYNDEGERVPETEEIVMNYEIAFADPENPLDTIDVMMEAYSTSDEDMSLSFWMTEQTEKTDTTSETTLSLMVKENEELLYWGIPYVASFDTETGEYDITISVTEDTEELMAIKLDSTFSNVVQGEGFTWTLDDLSMEVEGEAIGLTGNVELNAGVNRSYEPEKATMVCEASQGQLFTIMSEVMMNAQEWMTDIENRYM